VSGVERVAQKPRFHLNCKFMILSERKHRAPLARNHMFMGQFLIASRLIPSRIVASSLL
jgi:hypothetical protein